MTAVTRTAAIRAVGGFDERIRVAPDFDLWLRMARREKFVGTPRVTCTYRFHGGQITARQWPRQLRSMYESRAKLLASVEAEGDVRLAEEVRRRMRYGWEQELTHAWQKGEFEMVEALLECRSLVAECGVYARWISCLAQFPPQRLWRSPQVRNGVNRLVAGMRRRLRAA
jgi:hypothetical protein